MSDCSTSSDCGPSNCLPSATVLLHIGPYKTGSSAIQSALFEARPLLAEHGVVHPGKFRRLVRAGHAVLGWAPRGQKVPDIRVWERFAEAVRSFDGVRVCVSTENFGRLHDSGKAKRIVDDLGGERVHVVVGARSFHRLLPSQWQERVKNREVRSYADWLRAVLGTRENDPAYRQFWASHDLGATARTWLPVVGGDRFHVLVVDDDDRSFLFRAFERMLGLPKDLLQTPTTTNSSLSVNQLQVVRQINRVFVDRQWPDDIYRRLIQRGLIRGMQSAPFHPEDRPIPALPPWAVGKVREVSDREVETIEKLGADVIGDPMNLRLPDDYHPSIGSADPTTVSVDTVVSGLTMLLDSAINHERSRSENVLGQLLMGKLIGRVRRFGRRR